MRQAQAATAQGQPAEAFRLLAPLEVQRAGDPDFDLALGMAANAAGDYPRAILALERVVNVLPENTQARSELGRALFGVGDRKTARMLLSEGKIEGVPLVAGEPIDQLLQAVDRVDALGRSSYRAYAELSMGDDSNVNAGPALRNVAVPAFGGSLVDIQPSGVQAAARYANLGAGFSGRYVLRDPRWSLIGNANANARRHSSAGRPFDFVQFDVNGGVSYRVERHEYTMAVQAGIYDIDRARVRRSSGAVAEWIYRFDGFRQFSIYGQFGRLDYPQQPLADVRRNVVGVTYAQIARTGLFGYGGVYVGRETERSAAAAHLGHALVGMRGGLQRPLNSALAIFSAFSYERRRFGGEDPLFLLQRVDRQSNLSFGLSWVPFAGWRVTPQFSWARTGSSVPLADYRQRVISLAVRKEI